MTDIGSHAGVTHAMITADGRAVPITIHPETGAYMTPDGQTLVTQEVDGQQVNCVEQLYCLLAEIFFRIYVDSTKSTKR